MPFSEKISTAASSNSRRRSSAGRLRLLRLLGPVALLAGLFACRRWRFSTGPVWHGKRAVGMFVFRRDEVMRRSRFSFQQGVFEAVELRSAQHLPANGWDG